MLEHLESQQVVHLGGYHWSAETESGSGPGAQSLDAAQRSSNLYLRPIGLAKRGYDVFREEPALFLKLASTEDSEPAIQAFANLYGRLSNDYPGPSLKSWRSCIKELQAAVDLWQAMKSGDTTRLRACVECHTQESVQCEPLTKGPKLSLSDLTGKPNKRPPLRQEAKNLLNEIINWRWAACTVRANTRVSSEGEVEPRIVVDRQSDAAWIQFVLAVVNDEEFRACHVCGQPMKIAKTASRNDRVYCSTRCRVAAYRARKMTAAMTTANVNDAAQPIQKERAKAKRFNRQKKKEERTTS